MLYRVLMRLIEKGQVDSLAVKIDVFYAVDKLTETDYNELTARLAV